MSYEKVPQVLIVDVEANEDLQLHKGNEKSYRIVHVVSVAFFTFLFTLLTTVCMIPQSRQAVMTSQLPLAHTSLHNMVTRGFKRTSMAELEGLDKRGSTPKNILFPLYIDPSTNGDGWNQIYWAAGNYTKVSFTLVINPNNGPNTSYTDDNGNQAPDPDYLAGLTRLSNYPNIQVLGYVHQSYGARSFNDVMTDVNIWATWGNDDMYGIAIDGIFFDEGPSDTGAVMDLARSINTATKKVTGFNDVAFVVQNPGILPPADYFQPEQNCDVTIILEDVYSDYKKNANTYKGLAAQYSTSNSAFAFVFSGVPAGSISATKKQLVPLLKQVSNIFITDLTDQEAIYSQYGHSWKTFAATLNSM